LIFKPLAKHLLNDKNEGYKGKGRVNTKHKCPSRKRDSFLLPHIILCYFLDTALSFSWLAQPGVDFPGAWYHVLNRGTERRAIFRSTRCYQKFIQLLRAYPNGSGVRLHGYALMGNHYQEANLSKAVHWLDAEASPGRPRSTTGVRRGALESLTWTQIVQAVSNVWNEPWEELLSARGTGARQTALFIGRIRGRLSLKELGQLAGGIHHNAVGIAIRRFTQRLQSDRTLLENVSLVQKELAPRSQPLLYC
jgi:hypothetical protein